MCGLLSLPSKRQGYEGSICASHVLLPSPPSPQVRWRSPSCLIRPTLAIGDLCSGSFRVAVRILDCDRTELPS